MASPITSVASEPARRSVAPREHDLPLEGLRGLAALMVLYCHFLAPSAEVDPHYAPSAIFWWFEAGHGAVALFFVISGYVIGLTNPRAWSKAAARDYVWRRGVRLVPLYVLAIALSVAFRPVDSLSTIVGNLFFLQNEQGYGAWRVPNLAANTNLWSLNFEVLYYAVFLAIWRWRAPVGALFAGAVAIATLGYVVPSSLPPFLTTYAAGWVFWLAGLWLAWHGGPRRDDAKPEPWPSLLLLLVATWKMKVLFGVLLRTGLTEKSSPGVISLMNLDFVPICAVLVALVTLRRPAGYVLLRNSCLGLLVAFCAWRLLRGTFWSDPVMLVNGALIALAAALWWWRPSLTFFRSLAWSGFLCYGIYIFQRPAQWLVRDHWAPVSGSAFSFSVNLILVIAVTLGLAWIAERRVQPWVRARLEARRRRRRTAALPA